MAGIKVSIINNSTALADAAVADVVPALQRQVHEHFFPAWGIDADLTFIRGDQQPPADSWWLVILDDSDQAGALGYHDLTSDGLPAGKIFAKTDIDNHLNWTVTASHELLEMLCDPEVNLGVLIRDQASSAKLYSYEVCDPCEDDQFAYAIDGVKVSDFVLPAYFQPSAGKKYDYRGLLPSAVPKLLPGGYIGVYDVHSDSGWHQITAATDNGRAHRGHVRVPREGSRSDKRRRSRDAWRVSEPRLVPM